MHNDFLPHRGQKSDGAQPHAESRSFHTPEEVAAAEEPTTESRTAAEQAGEHTPPSADHQHQPSNTVPPKGPKRWLYKLRHLSKKQWLIVALIAVLVLGGAGTGAYLAWFHKPKAKPITYTTIKPAITPKPTPVQPVSTLTGLPVSDPNVNNLPVTAVMIENSLDARPQSGLSQAGVVFEAIAEGGITRFLTLWQDTAPDYIGPVRSVRPYYLQWLLGFDAAVAHVGGSGDALRLIGEWNVKNLDQFSNPAPYWRISSRYAPHNMYSSIPKLHDLEAQKGFGKSNYTGFTRKPEAPSAAPTARSIDLTISGYYYNVHYDYVAATNSYNRFEGNQQHIDANTNKQISPKVVIAMVMNQGSNGEYTTYDTIGSNTAYIFQDGNVTVGTWTKTANNSQFVFKDPSGNEVKLNPGQTWLTVVGSSNYVKYQ